MQTEFVLLARNPGLEMRIGAAIAKGRELAERNGLSAEGYAQALGVPFELLPNVESGEIRIGADILVHAAGLVHQPVSTLLGETDLYEVTLPELERQLHRLRRTPQPLTLGPLFT